MANELKRAALVDAARDLNKILNLSSGIDVKLGYAELREQVIEAIVLMKEDDGSKLMRETIVVVSQLRDAVLAAVPGFRADLIAELRKHGPHEDEDEQEFEARIINEAGSSDKAMIAEVQDILDTLCEDYLAEPVVEPDEDEKVAEDAKESNTTEKKAKEPKKVAEKKVRAEKPWRLGRFRPVRRGSHFATILDAHLKNNLITIEDAAVAANISIDKAVLVLKRARLTNGIDHIIHGDGELSIMLPKGIDAESVWHKSAQAQKPALDDARGSAPRRSRQKQQHVQEMYDAAKRGVMPEPITITSNTNIYNQRHLDALRKNAEEGDWKAVRAYKMNGSNTYAKLIRRYQELLLIAHAAQEEAEAA